MPGATPVFGIPYPFIGETITSADFLAFAQAVDDARVLVAGQIAAGLDRPMCRLVDANVTVAVGVETNVTFGLEIDNDGMFSAGTPTQVTIQTPGLYMATVSRADINGFATLTSQRYAIFQNGSLVFAERKNEVNSSTGPSESFGGLLECAAGDIIQVRLLWTGTGGPVTPTAFWATRLVIPSP